jgi:hypothetical protein
MNFVRRHLGKTSAALIGAAMTFWGHHHFHPHGRVLYAQSLPTTVHYTWSPNPASDAVVQYKVGLDAVPSQVVPLTSCTATLCTATITVATEGAHTARLLAENQRLSTDPTGGFNDSVEATPVPFVLKVTPPGKPASPNPIN